MLEELGKVAYKNVSVEKIGINKGQFNPIKMKLLLKNDQRMVSIVFLYFSNV